MRKRISSLERRIVFWNSVEKVCKIVLACGILAVFLLSGISDKTPFEIMCRYAIAAGLLIAGGLGGLQLVGEKQWSLEKQLEKSKEIVQKSSAAYSLRERPEREIKTREARKPLCFTFDDETDELQTASNCK